MTFHILLDSNSKEDFTIEAMIADLEERGHTCKIHLVELKPGDVFVDATQVSSRLVADKTKDKYYPNWANFIARNFWL